MPWLQGEALSERINRTARCPSARGCPSSSRCARPAACPRAGGHPPRPQAREHHAGATTRRCRAASARWSWISAWPRSGRRPGSQTHRRRHRAGDAGVHEPGADPGPATRRPERHLRPRHPGLRDVRRPAALRGRNGAGDDDRAPPRPADAAPRGAPDLPARLEAALTRALAWIPPTGSPPWPLSPTRSIPSSGPRRRARRRPLETLPRFRPPGIRQLGTRSGAGAGFPGHPQPDPERREVVARSHARGPDPLRAPAPRPAARYRPQALGPPGGHLQGVAGHRRRGDYRGPVSASIPPPTSCPDDPERRRVLRHGHAARRHVPRVPGHCQFAFRAGATCMPARSAPRARADFTGGRHGSGLAGVAMAARISGSSGWR